MGIGRRAVVYNSCTIAPFVFRPVMAAVGSVFIYEAIYATLESIFEIFSNNLNNDIS